MNQRIIASVLCAVALGLSACHKNSVILTPVVAPIAEQSAWQPVNAGINPDYQRWQSALGSIEFYHMAGLSADDVHDPALSDYATTRQDQMLAGINTSSDQLLGDVRDEVVSLAGQDFLQNTYRVRHADGTRTRFEQLLGVVNGQGLQISVQINDDVDSRSYEALQTLLVEQVADRLQAAKTP
jgi:hypothetical protein